MFQPNAVINGRYVILNEIARGGMGIIYLAIDNQFEDEVALKVSLLDERGKQAFENEAKLLSKLRHTGLPQVRGYFFEGNAQCLVMEYIEGENLHQILLEIYEKTKKGFSLTEALPIIEQLCGVVGYLHSQNPPVIHRDIKPENIKQMKNGQIILLDFGMAKSSHTQLAGGTPAFASAEQLMSMPTNAQSDIYSLGATIYNLLSGETPTPAPLRFNGLLDDGDDALKPLSYFNLELPPKVSEVISWAMSFRGENRPASVEEFWKEFKNACVKENNSSDPATTFQVEAESFQSSIATLVLTEPKSISSITAPVFSSSELSQQQSSQDIPLSIPETRTSFAEIVNVAEPLTSEPPPKKSKLPIIIAVSAFAAFLFISVSGATLWKLGFFSKEVPKKEEPVVKIEEKPQITLPIVTEAKNTVEISLYLKQPESSKKIGKDYIFKADNQAKYQGDLMYFGILPNKEGVLYVIWHDYIGDYLSLIYPTKRFPTSREIIKANKEMRYPPVQEIGFDKVQTAERDYNADRIYFIFAPNHEEELIKELRENLPEEKEVSLKELKTKEILNKLEKMAEQNSVEKETISDNLPIKIASLGEVIVGFIELKSAKK